MRFTRTRGSDGAYTGLVGFGASVGCVSTVGDATRSSPTTEATRGAVGDSKVNVKLMVECAASTFEKQDRVM